MLKIAHFDFFNVPVKERQKNNMKAYKMLFLLTVKVAGVLFII